MAIKGNFLKKIQDIVLGKRVDIESRMHWHWHHMYIRNCMAAGIDMSDWEFPEINDADQAMAESFFTYNRERNKYIASQPWPTYYQWLQKNRFNMENTQQVLAKLNPKLAT